MQAAKLEEIAIGILNTNNVNIRDVGGKVKPFPYTTGNQGPIYLGIKALVGFPGILKILTRELASEIHSRGINFDFIVGNALGGMVPGWQIRDDLSLLYGREFPFCYRSKEGELTGNENNPAIERRAKALIFDELVDYAHTTVESAKTCREKGYTVTDGVCLVSYNNPEGIENLRDNGINHVSLITLTKILDVACERGYFEPKLIASAREFLANPVRWQLIRNLPIPHSSVEKAAGLGYKMRQLTPKEAVVFGAPRKKVEEGKVYWIEDKE